MRRSVWIFLASIFLPSLGLAWMAVRSAEDQQVVLEHQQVIISQNITDALAQNIQAQMDQVRADFVSTTDQLLAASPSPLELAGDFNGKLRDAWPLAELGFAVNLDGQIYSPKPFDSAEAQSFRADNSRFLSNRENAEIYSSNSLNFTQSSHNTQSTLLSKNALATSSDLTGGFTGNTGGATQNDEQNAYLEKRREAAVAMKTAARQALPAAASESVPTTLSGTADKASPANTTTSAAPMPNGTPSTETMAPAPRATPAILGGSGSISPSPPKRTRTPVSSNTRSGMVGPDVSAAQGDVAAMDSMGVATASDYAPSPPPSAGSAPAPASLAVTGSSKKANPPPGALPEGSTVNVMDSTGSAANTTNFGLTISKIPRQVVPQQMLSNDSQALSNTMPEASDFRQVIGTETSGGLARFLENKLRLMVWSHPANTPVVFGAQLNQARLVDSLKAAFQTPELEADSYACLGHGEYCVAILDDAGQPVALSKEGFKGDWKHPFVATEIGEVLPHWEAALYLVDPQRTGRTARTIEATLALIVLMLVAAIVSGGSLVAADVRRQMRLAQQKTDFVSNVSHELKTPLTSIRMFADLLAEKRVPDEERQATYLRIISAEAARLTRLINNVLDFARFERGAPSGEHRDCDLVDAVRDVVATCGPHLEAAGLAFRHEIEAEALSIRGDRDALAQIILNLVSNAEKYGGSDILVRVRRQETPGGALGCVDVLDRGPGIPADKVRAVFEPFQRLDDSLASGVPGSGLGLTLARRMARAHGGDVTYSARAGGGSCFTLTVPLRPA